MADVKWIKVAVDMFDHDKIDFIRSLPEGDSIIVTWLQMLTIAGKSNNGGYLMVTDKIPYTEQFLSNKLRRQPVFLQFALSTLEQLNMINVEEGPYHITNWEKHQNANGLEKIKSDTAKRVAKHRQLKKEKALSLQCNVTNALHVTHSNETDIELELELENNTTLLNREFQKIKRAYEEIHKVAEMPYRDSVLLTKLIEEGFSSDLIIGTIREKYKPTVRTLKFYEGAIRDTAITVSHPRPRGNSKAAHHAPPRDAELDYRRREIARNKWINEGNDPNDFEY